MNDAEIPNRKVVSYVDAEHAVEIVNAHVTVLHFAARVLDRMRCVARRRFLGGRRRRDGVQLRVVQQALADVVDFGDDGLHELERLVGWSGKTERWIGTNCS